MPFPANLEALQAAGYVYSHWQVCPECGEGIEVWKTPGKRELAMQPMCELLRPAIRHYERCNIAPKQEEKSGTQGNQRQGTQGTHGRGKDSADAGLQEPAGRDGDGSPSRVAGMPRSANTCEHGESSIPNGGLDASGSGIKLYGVTGKNVIAAGYEPISGTLRIRFSGATWDYSGVPEDKFVSLRKTPFADRFFTTSIKGKFPGIKVED